MEKTVEMAQLKGGFCDRYLRGALDSSPLWGAAKVEDTYNLLGHALRKALDVIAKMQQRELYQIRLRNPYYPVELFCLLSLLPSAFCLTKTAKTV